MKSNPEFVEFVVAGPAGFTQGYVEGFLRGRGVVAEVFDAEAEKFDVATLREKISDWMVPESSTQHILVPADAAPAARAALAAASGRIAVKGERTHRAAGFHFTFRIYSPEHGARVRSFFEPLPPGVRADGALTIEEIERPGSTGIGLLTPSHAWELRGAGDVVGGIDAIVRLLRRCRDEELVHVSDVRLLEDPASGAAGSD